MDLDLYSIRNIAKILTVTVSLPPSNHPMLLCVTLRACPITRDKVWGKEKSGGTLILKSNPALSDANDYQIPKAV